MKKRSILLLVLPLIMGGCGKSSSLQIQSKNLPDDIVPNVAKNPLDEIEYDYYGFDKEESDSRLVLKVQNRTSAAYGSIAGEYIKEGVIFYIQFMDDDIYAHNVYDIGYDDNVELIFNLTTDARGWLIDETFHFLITAEGKTYFQAATSTNGFGGNLDPSLHAVPGENYIVDFHKTTEEVDNYNGFAARVFFSYKLLKTDYDSANGNISLCLGMRNTHCYGLDTSWKSYTGNGCVWGNASTFITLNDNNGF